MENTPEILFMNTDEKVNINGTISVESNENKKDIMYLSCSFNAETMVLNINMTPLDDKLCKAHAAGIKTKYEEFKKLVNERAEKLGIQIF